MLKQLELCNFKCYASAVVPFGGLTVFSGINGSGKSTVIQSLLLMRQQLLSGQTGEGDPVVLNGSLVKLGEALDVIPSFLTGHDDQSVKLRAVCDNGIVDLLMSRSEDDSGEREFRLSGSSISTEELVDKSFVYLSSERIGPRLSYSIPEIVNLTNRYGNGGEYAVAYLDRFAGKRLLNHDLANMVSHDDQTLAGCLSACMEPIHSGTRIRTQYFADARRVSLSYSFWNGQIWSRDYRAVNVGFGLTNVLPIFVALLRALPGELVIIENPEVHLHPGAQTAVGRFIAQVAATGVQVVVETHSDHVLNGIRLAVKDGYIRHDHVMLHFVMNDDSAAGAKIVTPHILPSGRIDVWPRGFFDEYENVQMKLF